MAKAKRALSAPNGRPLRRAMMIARNPIPATMAGSPAEDPRIIAIHAAKEAATLVLAELLHRADDVITADDMAELEPDIQLARNTIDDCTQKEIDLTAAGTTVQTLDPASLTKVQQLADQIDAATVRSQLINATLAGLGDILNTAVRIRAMV